MTFAKEKILKSNLICQRKASQFSASFFATCIIPAYLFRYVISGRKGRNRVSRAEGKTSQVKGNLKHNILSLSLPILNLFCISTQMKFHLAKHIHMSQELLKAFLCSMELVTLSSVVQQLFQIRFQTFKSCAPY